MTVTDNTNGAVYYYAPILVYLTGLIPKTYIGVLGNPSYEIRISTSMLY